MAAFNSSVLFQLKVILLISLIHKYLVQLSSKFCVVWQFADGFHFNFVKPHSPYMWLVWKQLRTVGRLKWLNLKCNICHHNKIKTYDTKDYGSIFLIKIQTMFVRVKTSDSWYNRVVQLKIVCFQGRPGHMIPFMGLQAFDFCASVLFTFALFSYMPYLKDWLLSLVSLTDTLQSLICCLVCSVYCGQLIALTLLSVLVEWPVDGKIIQTCINSL